MGVQSDVPQAVIDALLRGDKMEAIKRLREATGGDLKSAMEMVQQVAAQVQTAKRTGAHSGPHHQEETAGQRENRERTETLLSGHRTPTVMPGDRGGRGPVIVLLAAAAVAAAWLLAGP